MTRKPDIKTDRVAVITGGTFFGPDKDPNTVRAVKPLPERNTSKPWVACKVSRLKPSPIPMDDETAERLEPHFEVMHDVNIGTVEELVEQYRQRLTMVFEAGLMTDVDENETSAYYWKANEEFQALFEERLQTGEFFPCDGAYGAVWAWGPLGPVKGEEEKSE